MPEANTDQAPVQSVEDRIYAKFNDPEPEPEQEAQTPDAPDEVQEPQEEFAEIEYEGSRYQVPKALEPALMKNADYTQKTQELAKQREVLEQSLSTAKLMQMESEFNQSVAQEKHNLQVLDNYIKSLKAQNFNDMTTDDMVRNMHQIQQASSQYDDLSKQVESKYGEFKTKFQGAVNEAKAKTHELLAKTVPGYTPKSFEAVREYGKKQGFTNDVLDSIETDTKASAVLYKAMRFDQLQAEKVSAVKRLDAPVIKPGSSKPMPDDVKAKLNYKNALKSARTRDERNAITQKRVEAMFD